PRGASAPGRAAGLPSAGGVRGARARSARDQRPNTPVLDFEAPPIGRVRMHPSAPPLHRKRHQTTAVRVGNVFVGRGARGAVQSMANPDTADAAATARQCIELARAGSELVRITVNLPEAAAAVAEIKRRMLDAGVDAPLIGDFHYNGHLLLTQHPD